MGAAVAPSVATRAEVGKEVSPTADRTRIISMDVIGVGLAATQSGLDAPHNADKEIRFLRVLDWCIRLSDRLWVELYCFGWTALRCGYSPGPSHRGAG